MLNPVVKIIITDDTGREWLIESVGELEIVEDLGTITDTMSFQLPKKISWAGTSEELPIKRGNKVRCWTGFDSATSLGFVGFIRRIDTLKTPMRVECDDFAYITKVTPLNPKTIKAATLKEVMAYFAGVCGGLDIEEPADISFGNYRMTEPTVAKQMKALKDELGISSFFRLIDDEPVLHMGLETPNNYRKELDVEYGYNIMSEESLEYRHADDMKIKVKAIGVGADNSRKEVEYGDDGGETVTFYKYGTSDKKQLEVFAKAMYDNYTKRTGYKGTVPIVGEPAAHKGDVIKLTTSDGQTGRYSLRKVIRKFNTSVGLVQELELGIQL